LGAPITTRIGRKWSLIGSCVVFLAGGAIQTASSGSLAQCKWSDSDSSTQILSISLVYVGRLVCGLGVGTMSMVCPTYVSELSPKEIRGKVTG
jgi:MFS family permease